MSASADHLRGLRDALGTFDDVEGIRAVLDRLDRDLLPRTAGGHDHLIAGFVGPNNSGKSALFNAVVGGADAGGRACAPISPSLPTGGATRRLVGAAHPELSAVLASESSLRALRLRPASPGPEGVALATETHEPGSPDELLLVETQGLPESLLLVDTPDFDSVTEENRAVTGALLTVVDLAVVVVTRHTYQNHEVIAFLQGWLEHGRPWLLVYNEALDDDVTLAHAAKIEEGVGRAPEAVFASSFDAAVARGDAALVPTALRGAARGVTLGRWLREMGSGGDLKRRALEASLGQLVHELGEAAAQLREDAARAGDALARLDRRAGELGARTAREAMPMGPFLEAFREVLDERPVALQRELRRGVRWTSRTIQSGARWARGQLFGEGAAGSTEVPPSSTLLEAERTQLERQWPSFFERASLELRQAARAGDLPEGLRRAVEVRLAGEGARTPDEALAAATERLALDPALLAEYREACRKMIATELDGNQSTEWLLQIGVDALHLLPLGLAGVLIVQTGGLGADVAVAGGGALSTAAAERLSRMLGSGVAAAARGKWLELRVPQITSAVMGGLLGPDVQQSCARLEERAQALTELARRAGTGT